MYLLLLAVIYLAFISLGLPDSLLGAAWPAIRTEFQVPLSYMGLISMIISGGTIISSLMSERLTQKIGPKIVTLVSVLVTAFALIGFSVSTEFYQLCLWGIPYGLGAGAIDAALNNYVALHYNTRHMSWLHCFWGVGTIISPYLMGYAVKNYHWTVRYRMVAVLQIVIFVIFLLSFPLWKVNKDSQTQENKNADKISQLIKIDGVKAILVGFFCYCSAEATCMLWASSYLEQLNNLTKDQAASFGSLFFIGITVGRLISGFLSDKLKDNELIKIGSTIAVVGAVLIIYPNVITSVIGFIIIGLGCAPIYPCIIHSTVDNFSIEHCHGVIGLQMACAYIGSTFAPAIFSYIVKYVPVRIMPLYILVFFIVLKISYNLSQRQIKKL